MVLPGAFCVDVSQNYQNITFHTMAISMENHKSVSTLYIHVRFESFKFSLDTQPNFHDPYSLITMFSPSFQN